MARVKILVIEDDDGVRGFLVSALRRSGFEPLEARDARDGVDQFVRAGRVSLVITDLVMPGEYGASAVARIRELDGNVPIIAISGTRDVGTPTPLEEAMLLGANARLAKPFRFEDLRALMDALLPFEGPRA